MSWVSFFGLCVFETEFIQTRNEIHWNKEPADFDDLGHVPNMMIWGSHGLLASWMTGSFEDSWRWGLD